MPQLRLKKHDEEIGNMAKFAAHELAQALGSGLLSFPVTHFNADFSLHEAGYREHVEWLATYPIAGLFAAGGTGEYFSLKNEEVVRVVRAAAESVPSAIPVLASAGRNVGDAVEIAAAAAEAGADGLLLLPPYLTEASQEGLYQYVKAVVGSTSLGIVVYSRANAVYQPETLARLADELPNLIGYKDGVGNVELMTRVRSRLGDRLLYIGGLPTAETFALPYLELGVTTYSSAVFNFVPQFAVDFYSAVREHDRSAVDAALRDFVLPYTAIRDHRKGYAVSIVKAGMTAIGRNAGPVRPPLTDLDELERQQLAALVQAARVAVRA
jgi:5-dehydro-4-deoxyglucarate dehydratase